MRKIYGIGHWDGMSFVMNPPWWEWSLKGCLGSFGLGSYKPMFQTLRSNGAKHISQV